MKWQVIIPSCDAYSDLWPIFFHFLFKQWPNVPTPICLVSNYKTYEDPRVRTVRVGKDIDWAPNVHKAVQQLDAEYLVLILDDFFLDQPVPENWIPQIILQLELLGGKFVNLYNHESEKGKRIADTWFRRVNPIDGYGCFHAGLWKRTELADICATGTNIWKTESLVRRHVEKDNRDFYYLSNDTPFHITYAECVKGRFWKNEALQFLAQHGIQPDLRYRPCLPTDQSLKSKFLRSYFKRKMDIQFLLDPIFGAKKVCPQISQRGADIFRSAVD